MIIKGMKIQRLETSSRWPIPKLLLPENPKAIAPASQRMMRPARAGWQKKVVQSPQPQMTSARNGSVPPRPKARFLITLFRSRKEEGAQKRK